MRRSIFLKTFGGYVLIILLLVVLILVTAFGFIRSRTLDSQAASQERLAWALEPTVRAAVQNQSLAGLESYFRTFEKQTGDRLTFIDPQGVVLADSEEDPARMENHRFRPEVVQALEGRVGRSLRHSDTLQTEMLYIALPISIEGRLAGCLRVSSFVHDIDATLAGLKRKITQTTLLIVALALVLAFLVARSYTRPVGRMIAVSRKVAAGDFGDRVHLRRRDELGQLAASLNAMSERLGSLVAELTSQKEETRASSRPWPRACSWSSPTTGSAWPTPAFSGSSP